MLGARTTMRAAIIAVIGALVASVNVAPGLAQESPGVTLEASRPAIDFGERVRLRGVISPAAEGETVSIVDAGGRERATTTTDSDGSFSVRLGPRETNTYHARWVAALSEPVTVKVRPKVSVALRDVRLFDRARVSGVVRPLQDGRRVSISMFRSGHRMWTRQVRLTRRSSFKTGFKVAKPGSYRVVARFTDEHGAKGSAGSGVKTPPLPSLATGSRSRYVKLLEKRLVKLGMYLDGTNRYFSEHTADAMRAFNKVEGRARLGTVDEDTWRALASARRTKARYQTGGFHIEIDQTRQVLLTVKDGKVQRVIHVSTGRDGYTPDGTWTIYRKIAGYSGGRLYYPSYYEGRRALHGWPEVPTYNASHGCTRLPMWTAKWVHAKATMGTTVHIYH
jgi:lipoprotein-anchoring transpeptidase ErfK/SrfK